MIRVNKNLFFKFVLLLAVSSVFMGSGGKSKRKKEKPQTVAIQTALVLPDYPPDFIPEEEQPQPELATAPGYNEPMFDEDVPTEECPRNFSWIYPGSGLGGMAQPDTAAQIRWLEDKYNVGLIVSLTPDDPVSGVSGVLGRKWVSILRELGDSVTILSESSPLTFHELSSPNLKVLHLPVNDYKVPSEKQIKRFFEAVFKMGKLGKNVVVHCSAGLGRTGTLLAAWLAAINPSLAADQQIGDYNSIKAVSVLREKRPGSVESLVQHEFLRQNRENFSRWLQVIKEEYPLYRLFESFGEINNVNLQKRLVLLDRQFKEMLAKRVVPDIVWRVFVDNTLNMNYALLLDYLLLQNPELCQFVPKTVIYLVKTLQILLPRYEPQYKALAELSMQLLQSNILEHKYNVTVIKDLLSKMKLLKLSHKQQKQRLEGVENLIKEKYSEELR